jgi:GMP synthase-like glutamine amidotransferase
VIQHLPPEGPYLIAEALEDAGVAVDLCQIFAGGHLPASLDGYGGLVVMGGAMSASSDDGFATRTAEIDLLEDALERGLPALGVCLGAQLLAIAAGGKVYPGAEGPEIGWAPVSLVGEAERDPLFRDLPRELSRCSRAASPTRPPSLRTATAPRLTSRRPEACANCQPAGLARALTGRASWPSGGTSPYKLAN